jgi:hypothetical protein
MFYHYSTHRTGLGGGGGGGGGGGAGGGAAGLGTADNPLADIPAIAASLPVPASIIPDNVPVKNVAIGIISSKNLESIGDIIPKGCGTNIILYRTTKTIPVNVIARHIPIKNLSLTINSSEVYLSPLLDTISFLSDINKLL